MTGRPAVLADFVQPFPALDAPTEAALRASIERFGVLVPVVHDQHRKRIAWRLALACWALRFDRLGNCFEDVRWTT